MGVEYRLVIRRYAPFESFGGGFEGDNRGFSTSMDPKTTSRTIGVITLAPDGHDAPAGAGRSSGSAYVGPWAVRQGSKSVIPSVGQVRVTVSNVSRMGGSVAFSVLTSGNLPLKDLALNKGVAHAIDKASHWARPTSPKPEGTPDIDTYLDVKARIAPGALDIEGVMRGDSFPNAEVFLLDPKGAAFPLLDYQTSGGVAGPLRLVISHKTVERARFPHRRIPLYPDGTFVSTSGQQPVTVREK